MSQSESPLRAVIANIVTPAHTERDLRCLAQLADHAFALADQQAGHDPSNAPSGICTKNRQARILYTVEDSVKLPIKVVLYQDVPAAQIQRVVVNMQTETMQCDGHPSLSIETWQIEQVRHEIKIYMQVSLHKLGIIWKSPCSQKVCCDAWQDFSKRLESIGISSAQSPVCTEPRFFEKPCPSCEVLTTLCNSCHAVICLSWDCPASRLIPFQSCSRDTYMAACLPCLQKAQTIPPLGQCPECNLWFCDKELTWCLGRPKETANHDSVREHPPKPIVCYYCNPGQAAECSNSRCWSREGRVTSPIICQSCSPAGGVSCACERGWICDNCNELPTTSCFNQCPRCKRVYCVSECDYIQFCAECGRTTLCNDCAEEDQISFAGPVDGSEVQEAKVIGCRTSFCWKNFCEECLPEERKCADCNHTYCNSCLPSYHKMCRFCISKLSTR